MILFYFFLILFSCVTVQGAHKKSKKIDIPPISISPSINSDSSSPHSITYRSSLSSVGSPAFFSGTPNLNSPRDLADVTSSSELDVNDLADSLAADSLAFDPRAISQIYSPPQTPRKNSYCAKFFRALFCCTSEKNKEKIETQEISCCTQFFCCLWCCCCKKKQTSMYDTIS